MLITIVAEMVKKTAQHDTETKHNLNQRPTNRPIKSHTGSPKLYDTHTFYNLSGLLNKVIALH